MDLWANEYGMITQERIRDKLRQQRNQFLNIKEKQMSKIILTIEDPSAELFAGLAALMGGKAPATPTPAKAAAVKNEMKAPTTAAKVDDTDDEDITREMLVELGHELVQNGKRDKAKAAVKSFGIEKQADISDEDVAALYKAYKAIK